MFREFLECSWSFVNVAVVPRMSRKLISRTLREFLVCFGRDSGMFRASIMFREFL